MFINTKQHVCYMQTLEILCSEKKTKLLEWLLFNPTTKIKIRTISKTLGINAGYVSTVVKNLDTIGIVKNNLIDFDNPSTRSLKIYFNIEKVKEAVKRVKNKSVTGIGVYGSWAKGTNIEDSDLDLWIKTKKEISVKELSEIRSTIREISEVHKVSIIVLTKERLQEIKNMDGIFYASLLNSFRLRGEFVD